MTNELVATFSAHIGTIAIVLGLGWTVYRYARNMLHRDFVSREEFNKFRDEQKRLDENQGKAFLETSKNVTALADEVHQMAVDVKWIIDSLRRQEKLLTGEHKRPDFT